MGTPTDDGSMRWVDLERSFGDHEHGRGIDGVVASNVFGHGKSGAKESRRGRKRAEADVSVQRPAGLLLDVPLDEELDEYSERFAKEQFPYEGLAVEDLARAISSVLHGKPCPGGLVGEATQGVFVMLAKATRRSVRGGRGPRSSVALGIDEAVVAATWLARERGTWLQRASDPDLARLRVLRVALRENVPLSDLIAHPEFQRWRLGEQPNGRKALPQAMRRDSVKWDVGLARAWRALRVWERTQREANALLRSREAEGMPPQDLYALAALLDPVRALSLRQRGLANSAEKLRREIPPPRSLMKLQESDLINIVRLFGWLDASFDEPTLIERTLRDLRENGLSFEDTLRFAETGDTEVFLSRMALNKFDTRYTLQTGGVDKSISAVTLLARSAAAALNSETVEHRPAFEDAVFHRFPKQIVRESTRIEVGSPEQQIGLDLDLEVGLDMDAKAGLEMQEPLALQIPAPETPELFLGLGL